MLKRIHACIISLEGTHNRRLNAIEEIKKIDISWEIIDAINGQNLKTIPHYDARKGRRLVGFELTRGEIGCFLSHRLAWQQSVDTKRNVLVLEDDFVIMPSATAAIKAGLDHEELWDILRLQAMGEVKCKKIAATQGVNFFHNFSDPLGTTAYIVKPNSAQILLQMSDSFIEPVDHFVENYRKHRLKVTAIKPYPITIMNTFSTIDQDCDSRNSRQPIRGWAKIKRSIYRNIYRLLTLKSVP